MGQYAAAAINIGAGLSRYSQAQRSISDTNASLSNSSAAFGYGQNLELQSLADQKAAMAQQAQQVIKEGAYNAQQKADEVRHFASQQAEGYNSAGVLQEGSPLIVQEYTRQKGQQEIDMITQQAAAGANLIQQQSNIQQNQGRAALIGASSNFASNAAAARLKAGSANPGLAGAFAGLFANGGRPSNNPLMAAPAASADPLDPNANPFDPGNYQAVP